MNYQYVLAGLLSVLYCVSRSITGTGTQATGLLLTKGVALQHRVFWTAKSADVIDCARMCVKRKQCLSFNFDTKLLRCELNNGVHNSSETFKFGKNLVYSDIANWPSQLDPNCFGRPCGDDEVCLPGHLMRNSDCSYTCLYLKDPCPTGWSRNGGSCYMLRDEQRSWQEALASCQALGASLVEVDDAVENEFVKSVSKGRLVWIGLTDMAEEGVFRWAGSNTEPAFNDWSYGQPSNTRGKEHCVQMPRPQWNDAVCSERMEYVCEKAIRQ